MSTSVEDVKQNIPERLTLGLFTTLCELVFFFGYAHLHPRLLARFILAFCCVGINTFSVRV